MIFSLHLMRHCMNGYACICACMLYLRCNLLLLVRLLSDINGAIDKSQVTLLALFDVSAAFDTVDHEILLQRLSVSFGLSGNMLGWLTSFLQDRSFMVAHGS